MSYTSIHLDRDDEIRATPNQKIPGYVTVDLGDVALTLRHAHAEQLHAVLGQLLGIDPDPSLDLAVKLADVLGTVRRHPSVNTAIVDEACERYGVNIDWSAAPDDESGA